MKWTRRKADGWHTLYKSDAGPCIVGHRITETNRVEYFRYKDGANICYNTRRRVRVYDVTLNATGEFGRFYTLRDAKHFVEDRLEGTNQDK